MKRADPCVTGRRECVGKILRRVFLALVIYEHQKPLASVAGLIWLHLPGLGLPVVPQSLQIQ